MLICAQLIIVKLEDTSCSGFVANLKILSNGFFLPQFVYKLCSYKHTIVSSEVTHFWQDSTEVPVIENVQWAKSIAPPLQTTPPILHGDPSRGFIKGHRGDFEFRP